MIKLALPAGDLRTPAAGLLAGAGIRVEGYGEGSRSYRLSVPGHEGVAVRVFREKDIPIQVALGNYDLGVCSLAWVKEMQARFPQQPVLPLCDLGIGPTGIYAAAADSVCATLADLGSLAAVRIASDYPNLADAFARAARLPRYRVQAVWGAAEAYPPEDADVAVVSAADEGSLRRHGLEPLFRLLESSAWLVANAGAIASKDLSDVVRPLMAAAPGRARSNGLSLPVPVASSRVRAAAAPPRAGIRMAVPDGHQQRHVVGALKDAGIQFGGYDESGFVRRPESGVEGLDVKVVRPHDMPQLIALGEIDVAITGRDCLLEHLYSFPSSPVEEVADLQRGQYNLCAVVTQELDAATMSEAMVHWRSQGCTVLRVASEFPATADHYARSRHLWRYQVIPIAGASEGFVPEDADILIEGTETGRTLVENNLKSIDLLYRSTTCVVARKDAGLAGRRKEVFEEVVSALHRAAGPREAV